MRGLTIRDTTAKTIARTTLNDIPVGQVFRGRVFGHNSKTWTSGLFYKANGPVGSTIASITPGREHPARKVDCIVVRLDRAGQNVDLNGQTWSNLWAYCSAVEDYQPLDVELVIKENQ